MSVDVVSIEQAGELLGCGRSRVYELIASGTLEAAPKFGRQLRIYRASVDRALLGHVRSAGRKRRSVGPPEVRLEDLKI